MRNSIAAIALIRREREGQTQWLARWNTAGKAFSFVGGHKQDEETFRECLMREVIEELGLEPEADFVVENQPQSHLEYMAVSEGTQGQTAYTIELYPLQLIGDFSHDKLDSDPANRWLWESEIQTTATKDGQPVSGTMNLLLEMAGLLNTGPTDDPDEPA